MLDALLILFILFSAYRGWRSGLLVGGLGMLGLFTGTVLGLVFGTRFVSMLNIFQNSSLLRSITLLTIVICLGICFQTGFSYLGYKMRSATTSRTMHRTDSAFGALAATLAAALAIWMIGVTAKPVVPQDWAKEMNRSTVLTTVNGLIPDEVSRTFTLMTRSLATDWFPRVFSGLTPEPHLPIEPPDSGADQTPEVQAALKSVVKIVADSSQKCGIQAEGSGWVSSSQRVVTNAHVVAGSSSVHVQVQGVGPKLRAQVVAFDPNLDLAILAVPELVAPPLTPAGPQERGASSVVAGFPLGGPLQVGPSRIRGVVQAAGDNIYGNQGASRQVYSVYANVEHGNSGGPLLTTDGRVAGTVFAKSLVDSHTGYVLTAADTKALISSGPERRAQVGTGGCAAR